MWLLLKGDKPDEAWTNLVTAQMAFADAIKAHPNFDHLQEQVERLDSIERLIFPPQAYLSMGTTVLQKICSICQNNYEECDHISGRPYWGELCHTILRHIEVNHVAIVTDPANKLCRAIHFDVPGGYRNTMTWKVEAKAGPKSIRTADSGLARSSRPHSCGETPSQVALRNHRRCEQTRRWPRESKHGCGLWRISSGWSNGVRISGPAR
jgi:hypothetical protein